MHRKSDAAVLLKLALEARLMSRWLVVPFDNSELTCMSLSGHLVDIEGQVLVHQTGDEPAQSNLQCLVVIKGSS